MRGKAGPNSAHNMASGITPAYAGKSYRSAAQQRAGRDHPRVCGEKKRLAACAQTAEGSPPRMRGKEVLPCAPSTSTGITPAYAGKSHYVFGPSPARRDHPRVCGEKFFPQGLQIGGEGSPPRMRGKVKTGLIFVQQPGITPAYAGKSIQHSRPLNAAWDHPRVCGEKTKKIP